MSIEAKPGQKIRVTISKAINRAAAKKTIERLFIKDKSITKPIHARSRNFIELPKRRGGQIWTKRPNKVHPNLDKGNAATILATPQALRDLASVKTFVQVTAA
jgi:hypothetical protein